MREAASLSASEALDLKVIDLVAAGLNDLLKQLHGRVILAGGATITLDTAQAEIERDQPDRRSRLLAAPLARGHPRAGACAAWCSCSAASGR